jgi:ABC-type Fe3+ transport system substrate-binding protein
VQIHITKFTKKKSVKMILIIGKQPDEIVRIIASAANKKTGFH